MGFSLQIPSVGQPNSTEAPKIASDFSTLSSWGNGNVDTTDVKAAFAQSAGINQSGQTVKGSSIIATSETRTNTAYGTMPTPDQVTGIVLPSNGLIQVWYQATWAETVSGAANAAIFLGANQLKLAANSALNVQEAHNGGTANQATPLATFSVGLTSGISASGYPGDATTGQVVAVSATGGGAVQVFAAAGTYTVSIQFKASSGTVTLSNRRLYVEAISFV